MNDPVKLLRDVIAAADRIFVLPVFVDEAETRQRAEDMALFRLAIVNLAEHLGVAVDRPTVANAPDSARTAGPEETPESTEAG